MNLLDLVRIPEWWEDHWRGMPAFVQENRSSFARIDVHFRAAADHHAFRRLIASYGHFSQKATTRQTPTLVFSCEKYQHSRWTWVDGGDPFPPRYPIYIVSKGRARHQLTSRALHDMGVEHYVVVEQQEFAKYGRHKMPTARLLVLDPQYQHDYDACDDLGMTKSKGPGPARNFAWEHSIKNGHAWHWVMDDNIQSFYRLGHNRKVRVESSAIFRAMESFCERYENVYMAGPQYEMFAKARAKLPAFITNTRIYSCNLIRNDIPFRWRGRYNEDTDLSLRILNDGYCTVEFYAFLQNKLGTQRIAGGNTAEFYAKEGTAPKSQMLYDLHPNVTKLVRRWGREHHYVDYKQFASNELQLKPGILLPNAPDEFGMVQTPVMRRRRSAPPASSRIPVRYDPGMPDAIRVHFNSQADVDKFTEITGLRVENERQVAWFPAALTAGASATTSVA